MIEIPRVTEVQSIPEQIKSIAAPSFRERFHNASRYALAGFFATSLALTLACSPARAGENQGQDTNGPTIESAGQIFTPEPTSEIILEEPQASAEPPPIPEPLTKADILAQVDKTIEIAQSVDIDALLASLPPDTPDRSPRAVAKQNINLIVYGIDPKAYALGGITDRKYEPESLLGLKDLIANEEYDRARELIVKLAKGPVSQPFPAAEVVGDWLILQKDELDQIDPEFKFHERTDPRWAFSENKLPAYKLLVELHYSLP